MHRAPESPKVHLGIVTYNTDPLILEKTLASVQATTYPLQSTVLCNSNDDKYRGKVESLCKTFAIKFTTSPNEGFGAGHNRLALETTADFYVCCNPDIVLREDTIEKLVRFSEKHQDAVITCPRVLDPSGEVHPNCREFPTIANWIHRQLWRVLPTLFTPNECIFDYNTSQRTMFVSGCLFMIRQPVMKKLAGFDRSFFLYYEDADLSKRALRYGHNYFVADAVATHLWDRAWKKSWRAVLTQLGSLIHFYRKHGWV